MRAAKSASRARLSLAARLPSRPLLGLSIPSAVSVVSLIRSEASYILFSRDAASMSGKDLLSSSKSSTKADEGQGFAQKPRSYWKLDGNVKAFCDAFSAYHGFRSPEDWYAVELRQVRGFGGTKLLLERGSLEGVLRVAYPSFDFLPWCFNNCPMKYWANIDNQRRYIRWFEKIKHFNSPSDWYAVTRFDFDKNFGATLLAQFYGNSPIALLRSVFPDTDWHPWLFKRLPNRFYDNPSNIRSYLTWLRKTAGLSDSDVFEISHFTTNHGEMLLHKFGYSLDKIMEAAKQDPSPSDLHPHSRWRDMSEKREFMDSLAKTIGIKEGEQDKWYEVRLQRVLEEDGGAALLALSSNSLYELLSAVYPEVDWLPWKFTTSQKVAWRDPKVLRKAVDFVEKSLSLRKPEDWYGVTMKQLSALKLQYFFNKNGEGLLGVLRQVYPTYQWLPWMFAKVPSSVPKSENDIKLAINFVEQKLHISDPEGWNRVTTKQLHDLGVGYFFRSLGGIEAAMAALSAGGHPTPMKGS